MVIDRALSILVLLAVFANISICGWGYITLSARLDNVEQRQDRLAQAYIRADQAVDTLTERLAKLEGRLLIEEKK